MRPGCQVCWKTFPVVNIEIFALTLAADSQDAALVAPHRMSRDEETKAGRSFPLRGRPARLPDVCEASLQRHKARSLQTTSPPRARLGPARRWQACLRRCSWTELPVRHHVRCWEHWDQNPHLQVPDREQRYRWEIAVNRTWFHAKLHSDIWLFNISWWWISMYFLKRRQTAKWSPN